MVAEIFRPATIAEAARLAARPDTAVLGGGTWLNSWLAVKKPARTGSTPAEVAPRVTADGAASAVSRALVSLISLEALGLDFVEWRSSALHIGAAATFQQVLDAPGVPESIGAAFAATASRTLRNMVTVGGELGLCPADSALIPLLIALDGRVRLAGRRPLGVAEHRSALLTGTAGLIVEVVVPAADRHAAIQWLSRTAQGRRSLVIAVAATRLQPAVAGVRISASDGRGQVLRLADAEQALEGSPLPPKERIEKLVRAAFWPTADPHASTECKRYLAGVYAADLLHGLAAREASARGAST